MAESKSRRDLRVKESLSALSLLKKHLISGKVKLRHTLVCSIFLYASKTWPVSKSVMKKILPLNWNPTGQSKTSATKIPNQVVLTRISTALSFTPVNTVTIHSASLVTKHAWPQIRPLRPISLDSLKETELTGYTDIDIRCLSQDKHQWHGIVNNVHCM